MLKSGNNGRFISRCRGGWLGVYATFVTLCALLLYFGAMYCFSSCNLQSCESKHRRINTEDGHNDRWYSNLFSKKGTTKPKMSAFLVVLILSAPRNMERRVTIRQTWLKGVKSDVIHLFAIGSTNLEVEEKRTLESEISRFVDVLFLPNVNESYNSLTAKLLQSVMWIEKNVDFDFLLKCDDDSFVRIDDIVSELESLSTKDRLYWGFFDGRASVKKSGKWAEKQWLLCDHYLPYALGGGYVISEDLVKFVATNNKLLKLYKNEDIALGSWLAGVDVRRVHDPRFDTEYVSRGCFNVYLITHKQSVDQMREKYWLLQERGKLCATEQKTRMSYEYNWNVPPSRCCVRNDSKIP